jgi:hypothetical protein
VPLAEFDDPQEAPNILKRTRVHLAGFNLGLLMRKLFGFGTPRGLQGRLASLFEAFGAIIQLIYVATDPRRGQASGPTRGCPLAGRLSPLLRP